MHPATALIGLPTAALLLSSCFDYRDDYRRHRNENCYVRRAVCDPFYGCYYEWLCDEYHHASPDRSCRNKDSEGNRNGTRCDRGGGAADGGVASADGASATDSSTGDSSDAPADGGVPPVLGCDGTGVCADGFECLEGLCQPCPDGVCPCRSDDMCGADEACNLETGTCELIPCEQLPNGSDCAKRSDCLSIYSGENCTRPDGLECEAGDRDCTCEVFDFARCITRDS
jgi:hypothetical protein